jgi:hypothetical protein
MVGQMWGSSTVLQCRCGGNVNVEAHQLLPWHCHHSLNTVAAMLGQWRRRRLAFVTRGVVMGTAVASCHGEDQGEKKTVGRSEWEKKSLLVFFTYDQSIAVEHPLSCLRHERSGHGNHSFVTEKIKDRELLGGVNEKKILYYSLHPKL